MQIPKNITSSKYGKIASYRFCFAEYPSKNDNKIVLIKQAKMAIPLYLHLYL